MYIYLKTLEGEVLHTAKDIHEAGKSKCFVTVERTEDNWVYFKEIDPKTLNKHAKYNRIYVSWECTDDIAGNEFGNYLRGIEKISVDGMVAWDDHSEVSSTGTKHFTYVTEVAYAEVKVEYDKKMLFGVHAPIMRCAEMSRKDGHVKMFRRGWFKTCELNRIDSDFATDIEDASRLGAKLKYKVYAPAMNR